ncbi:MAG: ATP-binding protein [Desulfocapsaceae bacterium]|nr:ATP-binding protein [Desulfocapsaceae bacterium]
MTTRPTYDELLQKNKILEQEVAVLRENRQKLKVIMQNSSDWTYWITPEQNLSFISPSCERITGYRAEDFEADPGLLVSITHERERSMIVRHFVDDFSDARTCHLNFCITTREGEQRYISHYCKPVYDEDGKFLGRYVSNRDITEKLTIKKKLEAHIEKLEQRNKDLLAFGYMASHDLRESIFLIQAFSDRLRAKFFQDAASKGSIYLQQIEKASQHMQMLLDSMLNYSRIATQQKAMTPIDLNDIAKEVILDMEFFLRKEDAVVTLKSLPSVYADYGQMYQLLKNLISNALKFHKPGEVPTINIYSRQINPDQNTGQWEIIVEDHGIGFDEKESAKIFNLFERLHSKDSFEGTGIGLSICKRIAERHGGEIMATSIPGQGSKFIIRFPAESQQPGKIKDGGIR